LDPNDPNQVTIFNTAKLVQRIEELEDLVVELKTQSSPQESLDIKAAMNRQSVELNDLKSLLKELQTVRVKSTDLFDKNELYASFQKVMKERDELVGNLVT